MSANLIKKSAVALAISASFIAASAQSTQYIPVEKSSLEILKVEKNDRNQRDNVALREYPNYFIVKLESKPLSSIAANANSNIKGNRLNLSTAAAKQQINLLAKERAKFANILKSSMPDAKIERHYDTVFNGVVVTSTKDIYDTLLNLPGVTRVFREELYHANMDASLNLINATKVWEQMGGSVNAGKGVKVAVIDTGIRPENPMFADDSGFAAPEGLPTDDYCRTSAPDFCNNKLIVARSPLPTFEVHPDEHMSPLGYGSHGSHVAGTAVGNPVSINYQGTDVDISGVAPGAYLMAYKGLFTTPSGRGSGSNVMLLEMLDWAVKDGADVINNSWGGGAGAHPSSSPYGDAFLAAEEAGVVVVSAAGNDGPGAQSIGCPSCIESGITVANTTHGRFFGNSVDVGDDSFLAVEANNGLLEESITLPVVAALNVEEANFEGCSAYADSYFTDSIALVSRGACAFSDKTANAMAAGAEGIIIYNNNAAAPFTMYQPDAELPSLMISKNDGEAIIASLGDEGVSVTMNAEVSRIISEQYADNMATSSSRGPNGDHDSLKPDIAAPGTSILSAYSPDDSGTNFGLMTGTSMASPHVAGAAAVMKSLHTDWSATDIKTALTSTSKTTGVVKQDVETPVDAFDVGAGRLDLEMASKAVVTFDKPSFAKDPCVGSCTFTRTIKNMGDNEAEWEASVSFTNPDVMGVISPSMVTLAAKGAEEGTMAEFSLEVDSRFGEFNTWEFGKVTWKDKSGQNADVHMPVAIFASTSADSAMLSTFATETEVVNGEEFEINAAFNNVEFANQVAITATIPEGTTVVLGSESSNVMNGTEILLDHDEIANRITWTGKLAKPEMTSSVSGGIPYTLAEDGGTMLSCDGECDETAITLNFGSPAYKFNGVMYETITISDNGIIRAGSGSTSGSWKNQNLPDATQPNDIIAPFWTDFDLNGTANTSGGGNMYYAFLSDGSGTTYFVVEWYKAQPYADAEGREYTFQAWIALGEEEDVFFNYRDLADTLPENLSVGAENSTGSVGISHYYNGEGSAPMSDSSVNLNVVAGGGVSLSYKLEATAELDLGAPDTATVVEDAGAVTIDVLANENMSEAKPLTVEVMHEGTKVTAVDIVKIAANGDYDLETLTVSEPGNGVATVTAEGMVQYTPNANFSGTDTFTYQVKDQVGTSISATTVSVEVTPVNDAPTLSGSSEKQVTVGYTANLSVKGSDVDGDDLTYTWKQVAGTQVSANSTTNSIEFVAPSDGEQKITFEVTASDGEFTSNSVMVSANVQNGPSSGGSFGWLALLALPLTFLRRRKAQK